MAEEAEITLRLASGDPERVFREIAAKVSIGPFSLICRGTVSMQDTYFDTPERSLKSRKYALRLRTAGGRKVLGLKGKERANDWGGLSRLEIEGPWSGEILSRAITEIDSPGLEIRGFQGEHPLETLTAMGLRVIQSRETVRTLIDIATAAGREPIAEVALDRVHYDTCRGVLLHYEMEIEAREGGSGKHLSGFVSSLSQAFPGVFLPWEHNKLITGCALAELAKLGRLPHDTASGSALPLTWYGPLEDFIRQKRACS